MNYYGKMEYGYFVVVPTTGFGSFVIKVCIPDTGDYEVVEDYMAEWFGKNMKLVEKWELIGTSLFEGASNNYRELVFDKDSHGNKYYLYLDGCFTDNEPVENTVARYFCNKNYSVGDSGFTNEELSILSVAMVNLIDTTLKGSSMIADTECQKLIHNLVKKYKTLNDKVCHMMLDVMLNKEED